MKEWRRKNPDYQRKHREANRERYRELQRQWRKKNQAKQVEYRKKYYANDPMKWRHSKEYIADWVANNKERHTATNKKWIANRSEQAKERKKITTLANMRLRKTMLERDGFKCRLCGKGIKETDPFEMHEDKYERPVNLENLRTMHRSCHKKQHRKYKYKEEVI